MPRTFAFTIDAIGDDENYSPQDYCSKIVIYENNQAGTADYTARMPSPNSPQITKPAGTKLEISAPPGTQFKPGAPVVYLAAATGSLNMVAEEY